MHKCVYHKWIQHKDKVIIAIRLPFVSDNAKIMRWVLRNNKVYIVILLPVVSDRDKMLKYHDKQKCTDVFIM